MKMDFFKNKKILITGHEGKVAKLLLPLMKNYNISPINLEENTNADIIIHLVSSTVPDKIISSNVIYLQKVLNYSNKNNIKHIIFFSSASIYGKQNRYFVNEDIVPINPSLYGLCKFICEEMIKEEKNIKSLIIRLPAIMTKNSDSFIANLFTKIEKHEDIYLNNHSELFNGLITVYDIFNFMRFYCFERKYEILNLALNLEQTLEEIIYCYKKLINSSSKITRIDSNQTYYNLSISKSVEYYNFSPTHYKKALKEIKNIRCNNV